MNGWLLRYVIWNDHHGTRYEPRESIRRLIPSLIVDSDDVEDDVSID